MPASLKTALTRFIPARAGNTHLDLVSLVEKAVHPRAGGEHVRKLRARSVPDGSSPRGRGTQRLSRRAVKLHRFIPARAGNT